MIVVIADDFTGAAELAGIAISYGLKTEVQTKISMNPEAGVIIIDTNTRSKTPEEAIRIMDNLLHSLEGHKIELLFKKTDSVLRGHVYEELSTLLKYFPEKSIVLAPANPSKSRTISGGTYFIGDKPLHETFFATDPEAPVVTSDVLSLIGSNNQVKIELLDIDDEISVNSGSINIAGAKNSEQVLHWANKLNDNMIPAGAADFFGAILYSKGYRKSEETFVPINFDAQKSLFICGSSLSKVVNIEEELFPINSEIVEISEDQICSDDPSKTSISVDTVVRHFRSASSVILFVNIPKASLLDLPTHNIPKCLARIASGVLEKMDLNQVFIEGGTTSSEVVRNIGWWRFTPVNRIGNGVVRMEVTDDPNHSIIVKPGSYKWPDNLWKA